MGTLTEKLDYLKETKNQIKEAIISKGQPVSSSDTFRSYASKITAIDTVNNEDPVTVTPTTSSQTVTPDQNHTGLSSVTVSGVTSAIDANIQSGNIKKDVQILGVTGTLEDIPAVVESLSITPSTSSQTFTPTTGVDGYAPVSVSAVDSSIDANITAGNIKSGVEILGVEGTYAGEAPVLEDKVILANGEYTADEGYDGIGTATVAVNATGHVEEGINRTGSAISSGDKVWVNKEFYEAGELINSAALYDNNTASSIRTGLQDADLTCGLQYTNSSSVLKNTINWDQIDFGRSNFSAYYNWSYCFDELGNCLTEPTSQSSSNYKSISFSNNNIVTIDLPNVATWYPPSPILGKFEYYIDTRNGILYKIDRSTGIKLFEKPVAFASYTRSAAYAAKGYGIWLDDNFILIPKSATAYDKYTYDSENDTLVLAQSDAVSLSSSALYPLGLTPDKKYLVCRGGSRYEDGNYLYLWNPRDNSYKQYAQTNPKSYPSSLSMYYYPKTGIFFDTCIPNTTTFLYHLYRYNTSSEEFETLSLDTTSYPFVYSVSQDLDKILWASTVVSSSSGMTRNSLSAMTRVLGNNLVTYTNSNIKTITGTAAENIAAGSIGNVYLGDKGTLQSKVVTSNGTVTPSEGYYGLSKVTVNVVGTGIEVEGKNYTGAVINEGDKVWINPYYYEAGTKFSINNSMSGNYGAVLTPDGSKYIATNKLYNVNDNSNLGTFANTSSVSYSNEFRVFSNGEMYRTASGYLQRCDSGLSWNRQNTYPIFGTSEYIYNSSTNAIEQIDPNDGSTIKSYGFSDSNASWLSYSNSFFAIFIDKNHILWPIGISNNNGNTCIVHLDDDNNTVVLGNNANINLCFHYISNPNRCCCIGVTSDKKYALVTTSSSSFNIYKLGDGSNITEIVNSDLKLDTSFLGNSYNCCAIYYTDKDILFNNKVNSWSSIYSGTNLNNTKVYKYNPSTEEFKQVSIDFEGLFGGTGFGVSCVNGMIDIWYTQHSTGWKYVLTSEEKSGNNLVNYGSAVTSNTQTGTATESIAIGNTGTVKVGAFFEPVVETLNVTPTTSAQTITPSTGVDGYAPVTVSAVDSTIDQNIIAVNIKKDVTILGVTGTLESTNIQTLKTRTIESTDTLPVTIIPSSGYNGMAEVDIVAIENLSAENIKKDIEIAGVTGTYEGTVINNQDISITTDGVYTAEQEYTGLGTVTVTAGSVSEQKAYNEMAERLMLINDGEVTFTLTVSPTTASVILTSVTNSTDVTPTSSSSGVYEYPISADSTKNYNYTVSAEGYTTQTGTVVGGTTTLSITLVTESNSGEVDVYGPGDPDPDPDPDEAM